MPSPRWRSAIQSSFEAGFHGADVAAINWLQDVIGEQGTTVVSVIGAWTALMMEAELAILLARALVSPQWRRPAAVLGIALHVGMATTMPYTLNGNAAMTVFALASWAMYVPLYRYPATRAHGPRWNAGKLRTDSRTIKRSWVVFVNDCALHPLPLP